MSEFFRVMRGLCDGDRHVEVLRPFEESDFEFEAKVTRHVSVGNRSGETIAASVQALVEARPSKEAMAAIHKVFHSNALNCRHDRYHREATESLNSGLVRAYDTRSVDFRGCSGKDARDRKLAKALPQFEAELEARIPELKAEAVKKVNDLVAAVIKHDNEACVRGDVQAITREPWEWLDEQAKVTGKVARIKELREEIALLRVEVQEARNEACLKSLRDDKWTVTVGDEKIALCGESRHAVEEVLSKGEGFQPDPMRR